MRNAETAHETLSGPDIAERVTVALTRKAAGELQSLKDRTDLSKTDLINRAVILYAFIDEELSSGADLLVRREDETRLVKLL